MELKSTSNLLHCDMGYCWDAGKGLFLSLFYIIQFLILILNIKFEVDEALTVMLYVSMYFLYLYYSIYL